jgi:probable pyridine nucleotide-disulfide oxidoreductase
MLFYKFVIIGAGQTGLDLAFRLAHSEQDVLLVETNDIGGSYLFSHEFPKKAFAEESRNVFKFGRIYPANSLKQDVLNDNLKQVIKSRIVNYYKSLKRDLKKLPSLEIVMGQASFNSKNLLSIKTANNEKQVIAFEHCIIATGLAQMQNPSLPGITKTSFLHQHNAFFGDTIPKTMGIWGITEKNLEVADIYANLGTKVTIFEQQPPEKILPQHDTTTINYTLQNLLKKGVELYFEIDLENIKQDEETEAYIIKDTEGNTYEVEQFYSHVQETFYDNLNLTEVGIKFNEQGVYCTASGQTTQKNIWAFGQAANSIKKVNLNYQLHNFTEKYALPKNAEDKNKSRSLVVLNNNSGNGSEIAELNVPNTRINLGKPIGTIGMSYKEAVNKYGAIVKFDLIFNDLYEGFIKVIYNEQNGHILGLALTGEVCEQFYNLSLLAVAQGQNLKSFRDITFNLGFKK